MSPLKSMKVRRWLHCVCGRKEPEKANPSRAYSSTSEFFCENQTRNLNGSCTPGSTCELITRKVFQSNASVTDSRLFRSLAEGQLVSAPGDVDSREVDV